MFDFGTGGLDLAYEVMRGYDALVLVDVSRQGGEPGTLYVMEADEEEVEAGIEDGQVLNPHGMDPQTVLRFVKTLGAWPGKVVVVACEPAVVEEMGIGLSERGRARRRRRRRTSCVETVEELQPTRPTRRTERMHELSLSGAIVNTVVKHADGRPVSVVTPARRRAAPGRARTRSTFYFGFVARGHGLRGRAARAGARAGAAALRARASASGRSTCRSSAARRCGAPAVEVVSGRRVRGGVDRGRGGRMHRTKVRVVEEALDANNTIAQANRADFDRAGVRVVNFMSAPGAGKTTLLERVVRGPADGVRVGVLEGDVQGSMDADRLAALHVPVTQLNTDPASAASATSTRTWCARRCPRCRSTRSTCW